jgi:hypothetical protein
MKIEVHNQKIVVLLQLSQLKKIDLCVYKIRQHNVLFLPAAFDRAFQRRYAAIITFVFSVCKLVKKCKKTFFDSFHVNYLMRSQ